MKNPLESSENAGVLYVHITSIVQHVRSQKFCMSLWCFQGKIVAPGTHLQLSRFFQEMTVTFTVFNVF